MSAEAKCPFRHGGSPQPGVTQNRGGTTNRDWWPNQLRVDLLHQHSSKSDPMGASFDYAKQFNSLNYAALKQDLTALMT